MELNRVQLPQMIPQTQQPTVGPEKSAAQEQPVVSPEATNEPLGQPTEVAPTENELINQRLFLKNLKHQTLTKQLMKRKDPNITVVENQQKT